MTRVARHIEIDLSVPEIRVDGELFELAVVREQIDMTCDPEGINVVRLPIMCDSLTVSPKRDQETS